MKETKQVTTTTTHTQTVRVVCDLCGKVARNPDDDKCRWNEGGCFDVADTKVRLESGTTYPEGGSYTRYEVDVCPDCFRKKLIPWVESHGGSVRETEVDV